MNLEDQRVAFCGTGQMATALASGFCRQLLSDSQISGYDPGEAARQRFRDTVGSGVVVGDDPKQLVPQATVVIVAVKPQIVPAALQSLRPLIQPSQLVISIAAGISLQTLANGLPDDVRLIRVMPNTPCLIGRGACGLCDGPTATAGDVKLVTALLQTVGIVEAVPEAMMDAVTGLSGSGPAYVFRMIQALSDGAVSVGMPRDMALRLAAQTVAGAAEMVQQLQQHPAVLTDAVTSPGGTTIAGLHALESGSFNAIVMDAVVAAARRSQELGS
jgi:pyrroline-5-carboxylate reductase